MSTTTITPRARVTRFYRRPEPQIARPLRQERDFLRLPTEHYQPNEALFDNLPPAFGSAGSTEEEESSMGISLEHASTSTSVLISMLQQQQSILTSIQSKQEELRKDMVFANSQIEKRLDVLEDKVKGSSLESSPSSSSSERKKIRVTRDLTQKVAAIHDKLDEGFKPEESIKSEHNVQIRDCLVREVSLAHSEKYKEADVAVAVKRKYESLRRTYKEEEKENYEELSIIKSKEKKYRQRRRRKFDNRALMVRENEMKHWKQLSVNFMTEESDGEDDTLVIHEMLWRSNKLSEFLHLLDKRYEDKVKKEGTFMARKKRVVGEPSLCHPPKNAPKWTVE